MARTFSFSEEIIDLCTDVDPNDEIKEISFHSHAHLTMAKSVSEEARDTSRIKRQKLAATAHTSPKKMNCNQNIHANNVNLNMDNRVEDDRISEKTVSLLASYESKLSPDQHRVWEAVIDGKSVFFTGAAGSGKSFLLSFMLQKLPITTTYVTASTGVAAVALRGKTLHHFAGVGVGEGNLAALIGMATRNRETCSRWNRCKILIIDEISMIDADYFDKLDHIARAIRRDKRPFGGIQLVISGDFLQLPSIKGKFVFQAKCWKDCIHATVQLKQVFRQSDTAFISVLNKLREGIVDANAYKLLKPCVGRQSINGLIKPTRLYCYKRSVDEENMRELSLLSGEVVQFRSLDTGNSKEVEQLRKSCIAPENLYLKKFAQVMLLKNLDFDRGLVNGARGVVLDFKPLDVYAGRQDWEKVKASSFMNNFPIVRFANGAELHVLPAEWDIQERGIRVAARKQVPLMLAYALTIHKSQGMTLSHAHVHIKNVFNEGQAYVALSRVTSLDGLTIDHFDQRYIKASPAALQFYRDIESKNCSIKK